MLVRPFHVRPFLSFRGQILGIFGLVGNHVETNLFPTFRSTIRSNASHCEPLLVTTQGSPWSQRNSVLKSEPRTNSSPVPGVQCKVWCLKSEPCFFPAIYCTNSKFPSHNKDKPAMYKNSQLSAVKEKSFSTCRVVKVNAILTNTSLRPGAHTITPQPSLVSEWNTWLSRPRSIRYLPVRTGVPNAKFQPSKPKRRVLDLHLSLLSDFGFCASKKMQKMANNCKTWQKSWPSKATFLAPSLVSAAKVPMKILIIFSTVMWTMDQKGTISEAGLSLAAVKNLDLSDAKSEKHLIKKYTVRWKEACWLLPEQWDSIPKVCTFFGEPITPL